MNDTPELKALKATAAVDRAAEVTAQNAFNDAMATATKSQGAVNAYVAKQIADAAVAASQS